VLLFFNRWTLFLVFYVLKKLVGNGVQCSEVFASA